MSVSSWQDVWFECLSQHSHIHSPEIRLKKKPTKSFQGGRGIGVTIHPPTVIFQYPVERGNSRGISDSGETLVQRLIWDKESQKSNKTWQYLSLSQKISSPELALLSLKIPQHLLISHNKTNSNTYFQEGNGVTGKSREGGGRAYPRTDGQLDWLNWALASRRRRRLFLSQPKSERQNYPAATNQHNTAFVLHTNTQARTHAVPPPQTLQPYR